MRKTIITTNWLVATLRTVSATNPYVQYLNIPEAEQVDFVTDLLHSALQTIFQSQERYSDYDYEILFAKYVNAEALFHAGRSQLGFEEEVSEIPYFDEIQQTTLHREVKSLPSTYGMCASAFDDVFHDFVSDVVELLGGDDEVNTYAEIKLLSINPRESFAVEIGADIRYKVFKEIFPDGRYDSKLLEELRNKVS